MFELANNLYLVTLSDLLQHYQQAEKLQMIKRVWSDHFTFLNEKSKQVKHPIA